MKILVAGGAGFIGSNFIRHILRKHADVEVLNYDKLTYAGNLENLKDVSADKRYRFVKGDIADSRLIIQVFETFRPDYVINFAAETHVDRSINLETNEFLDSFIHSNIAGVHNLLEAIKKYKKLKKFVQVSTDEVYGSLELDSPEKFHEGTPLKPRNLYAVTKASGDFMCHSYYNHFGLPLVIARPTNNFGPNQYPEKFTPYSISKLLNNKKVVLHGDGRHVRDWLYTVDCSMALELCLFQGRIGEIYNIGANKELNNLEIARLIVAYLNRDDSWIEFIEDRPGNDRRYASDNTKIQKELGWKPVYDFHDAFRETIEWYLDNRKWLEHVLRKNNNFDQYNFYDSHQ